MKTKLLMLAFAFTATILASCKDEDETFHSIDIESTGIDLVKDKKDQSTLSGDISSEGAQFILQGTGKYADMAYVTEVTVDNVRYDIEGNDRYDDSSTIEGDWGKIVNSFAVRPYKMLFEIKPNDSDKERIFFIKVGYGYWYRNVIIRQAKRE